MTERGGVFAALAAGLHFDRSKQPQKLARRGRDDEENIENGSRKASHQQAGPSDRQQTHTGDPFEAANAARKRYRIHVKGEDVPAPLKEFSELRKKRRFYARLLDNVAACGFAEPTPVQRQAIPLLMARREVMAVAPTGSGKTLAFLLPLVIHAKQAALKGRPGVKALVVSPTRELAVQSAQVLARLVRGLRLHCCLLRAASVSAGTDFGKMEIVVGTPLRLAKLAKRADCFGTVEFVVLDEADKLLDEAFLRQIDRIIAACTHPRKVVALFSATLPERAEELARSVAASPVRVTVGERNAAAAGVHQRLVFVGSQAGKAVALRDLLRPSGGGAGDEHAPRPPYLVFANSKQRAAALQRELALEGILAESISAEQSPAARAEAVARFREGRAHVLVATDLLARGIDFLNVSTVINYDFPLSAIDYVHRIGRTGRAGRAGCAVTFFEEKDAGQLRRVANLMQASGMPVPEWMLRLSKEPTVLKQRQRDQRKRGQPAHAQQPKGATKRRKKGDKT